MKQFVVGEECQNMKPFWLIRKLYRFLTRNAIDYEGVHAERYRVNLHYWTGVDNLGDALAPAIYAWMLQKNGLSTTLKTKKKYVHLLTVGSVLGEDVFDATVWGSGIHKIEAINQIRVVKRIRKLDIRAVRGPVTRAVLKEDGYDCPAVYGDPAILLPNIYHPGVRSEAKYEVGLIRHFREAENFEDAVDDLHKIDVVTTDYMAFVDELLKCRKVISSSLHGIILAESYGIPAVFLVEGIGEELIKFYDWYFSTGRYTVKIARSLKEALSMEPMPLPQLEEMREKLIDCFPVDLWKTERNITYSSID